MNTPYEKLETKLIECLNKKLEIEHSERVLNHAYVLHLSNSEDEYLKNLFREKLLWWDGDKQWKDSTYTWEDKTKVNFKYCKDLSSRLTKLKREQTQLEIEKEILYEEYKQSIRNEPSWHIQLVKVIEIANYLYNDDTNFEEKNGFLSITKNAFENKVMEKYNDFVAAEVKNKKFDYKTLGQKTISSYLREKSDFHKTHSYKKPKI